LGQEAGKQTQDGSSLLAVERVLAQPRVKLLLYRGRTAFDQ